PDHDLAQPDGPDEHALYIVLGREVREAAREREHDEPLDAVLPLQLGAPLERGQQRDALASDVLEGVTVERDDRRNAADVLGALAEVAEDGLVPEVDAVEGADGEHAAAVFFDLQ